MKSIRNLMLIKLTILVPIMIVLIIIISQIVILIFSMNPIITPQMNES